MSITRSEKQRTNRLLTNFKGEERRRLRQMTDFLEEAAGAPEVPGRDYKFKHIASSSNGLNSNTNANPNVITGGNTALQTKAATNLFTRQARARYTGAAATSSIGGFAFTSANAMTDTYLRPANEGGGFDYTAVFGGSGFTVATARMFMGYMGNPSVGQTDADPSGLVNIIGVGFDDDDTQVQFMHNDGSGTATKIPLGTGFPKPTANQANMYVLRMSSLDGVNVSYSISDLIAGSAVSGVVSTDLPASTEVLSFFGYVSAGGTSTTSQLEVVSITETQPNVW